jgi:tetratricopeptide (TPR) repeat protein
MLQYLRASGRGLTYPVRAARRRPWLALLGLAVLGLAGAVAAGGWYVYHQWEQAQADLAADRPKEALSRLEICLHLWPRDPEVRLLAARAARLSGDLQAAEAHLKQCIKSQGGATEAVQLEFLLLRVQTGEVDEVAPTLVDCVEKGHRESPLILETMAGAYMARLRYRSALACLSRWIEVSPQTAKALYWRGLVLERLNHHKDAARDYRQALKLDPGLFRARLRVAELLLEDKRTPEALPHLERLYREAPDHPEVQARLGICRYLLNQRDEARRLMEAAVVRLPNDPALLVHLARLDLEQGRAAEAERRLRKVLKMDPADTEALHNLVNALQFQGKTEEAAAALKEHQKAREQVDRANQLLREVADSPSATPADFAEVGELLLRIGRDRQGVYWLEQALERDPGQLRAHTALAAHYEHKGESDRAASHRRWLRDQAAANPKSETRNPKPTQNPKSQ